jgi:opacity protein-like surface antigen
MISFLARNVFCSCLFASFAIGGTQPDAKSPALPPPAVASSLWEVTVRPYGWLAGVEGTVGVRGYTAETDIPFKDILSNLDMVAALQLEVKRDRWMVLLDGMYIKMSDQGETPGRLLSTINVEVEQIMAEAAIGYRLWESDRGYFDVFAGARYLHLGTELGFNVDAAGVESFSEDLSQAAVSRISSVIREGVGSAAAAASSKVEGKVNTIAREVESQLRKRVGEVLGNHPNLPRAIDFLQNRTGPVSEAIRELAAARVAEKQGRLNDATAAVSAEVSAAKARVREKAQRAVSRAEKNLARRIETALRDAIPDRVSGAEDWIDPIIGLRTRYNFTTSCYAVGRADIGGFGVGSDFAWQAYAGVGYQFNPKVTLELGYRYLQMDYTSGGFTYDTATAGVFTALGIRF